MLRKLKKQRRTTDRYGALFFFHNLHAHAKLISMTKLKPKYKTIALTGPQGSGKTTQLKLLLEKVDAEFASVGDILRSILPHSEKPEHQEARDLMYAGKLIPEQITFEILKDYFAEKQKTGATKEVLIFDGFPRSVEQAEHLYELNRAYHGVVDDEAKKANASGATENLPDRKSVV